MHSFIIGRKLRWISFLLKAWICISLERISHPVVPLTFHEAFLEDQRSILLHIPRPSILLALLIHHHLQFINWLNLNSTHFNIHLNDIPGLLGHHIVQLSCKIFCRKTEILGQNHMS